MLNQEYIYIYIYIYIISHIIRCRKTEEEKKIVGKKEKGP